LVDESLLEEEYKEFVEETVKKLILGGYKNKKLFIKLSEDKLQKMGIKFSVHDPIISKIKQIQEKKEK
jgi:hypothetical protein